MASKRGRLVLGIVLTALVALVVVNGPHLWRLATLKTIPLGTTMPVGFLDAYGSGYIYREPVGIYMDPNVVRGWTTVKRWSDPPIDHGKGIGYWIDTGFKRIEFECRDGFPIRIVYWTADGTVEFQLAFDESGEWSHRSAPPWLGGVRARLGMLSSTRKKESQASG